MKKEFLIVAFISLAIHNASSKNIESIRVRSDSIFLLTLIDLFEVGGTIHDIDKPMLYYKHELDSYGNRLIKNNPYLAQERENISVVTKRSLKIPQEVVAIDDTSCLKKLLTDSISRRNPDDLSQVCRQCRFKKLLLLDVQWRYLATGAYDYRRSAAKTRAWASSGSIPGTWWKIRVKYFEKGKLMYSKDYFKFKMRVDYKPEATINKYNYSRFFRKVARDFSKFLVELEKEGKKTYQ